MKLQNITGKQILKVSREKGVAHLQKNDYIKMTEYLSSKTDARIYWNYIFKVQRKKWLAKILCSVKLYLKRQCKLMTFRDKKRLNSLPPTKLIKNTSISFP